MAFQGQNVKVVVIISDTMDGELPKTPLPISATNSAASSPVCVITESMKKEEQKLQEESNQIEEDMIKKHQEVC